MKISIVIPVYNMEKYIHQAIESALSQTYSLVEVIVINDGSTDKTENICFEYSSKIKYVKQENSGPSVARNTGIKQSSGDAIVFLDGDDLLAPDWVEKAISVYQARQSQNAKIGIVYGNYESFDEARGLIQKISIPNLTISGLLKDSLLIPSGTFITKECLDKIGFFREDLRYCEDWDYWLRVALAGLEFVHVDLYSFKHREHGSSLSKQKLASLEGRITFLKIWSGNDNQLNDSQRMRVKKELALSLVRVRRVLFLEGKPTFPYLSEAINLSNDILLDPFLFVYGAVYASPFFRKELTSARTKESIINMHQQVVEYLNFNLIKDSQITSRLKSSASLAIAIDNLLSHQYLIAIMQLLKALVIDIFITKSIYKKLTQDKDLFNIAKNVL